MASEFENDEVWPALGDLLATVVVDRMRLCSDFEKYLQSFRGRVLARIQRMLVRYPAGIKVQVIVAAEYEKVVHFRHPKEPASEYDDFADAIADATDHRKSRRLMAISERAAAAKRQENQNGDVLEEPERKPVEFYLRTKFIPVTSGGSADMVADAIVEQLRERHINFIRDGSGLRMRMIRQTEINICSHAPLAGRGYVELPPFLAKKKAIVNIHNTDNRCFAYAIAAAIQSGGSHQPNAGRCSQYDATIVEQGLDQIEFPVRFDCDVLQKLEQQIQIPFNVYSFFDDEGRGRYAAFTSRIDADNAIDLLYWNEHYAWIKNFSRFMGDLTKHKGALLYCKRCLGHFQSGEVFETHKLCCRGNDGCFPIFKMPSKPTQVEFKHIRYEQRCPFVIYADFECLTEPIAKPTSANGASVKYQEHRPISIGLKLVSSVSGVLENMTYETYTGGDVVRWFLERLVFYEALCTQYLFDNKRLRMSDDDVKRHDAATLCYVCNGPFTTKRTEQQSERSVVTALAKVRDHDHITGEYRGAAHSKCNLQLRRTYKIPVFFHNFRGYDSHLLIRAFGAHKGRELHVIGQTLEKYMTVSWGDHIVFKDSLQFLGSSLERLTECLLKGGRDKFKHLVDGFSAEHDADAISVLLRKGVYPYDYMDTAERLKETALPPITAFASRLRNEQCTAADYEHAQCLAKVQVH